jgi:hypothetical protein
MSLGGMFAHTDKPRLPFGPAVRRYWLFLLGLVLFHFLVVFFPAVIEPPVVMIVLFFGVTIAAMWPWLFRDAPYTFWIFACVYWVGGAILMMLLKVVLIVLGVISDVA